MTDNSSTDSISLGSSSTKVYITVSEPILPGTDISKLKTKGYTLTVIKQ